MVLFRLTFDLSLTRNITVCSELERAITAALESIPENGADDMVRLIPYYVLCMALKTDQRY